MISAYRREWQLIVAKIMAASFPVLVALVLTQLIPSPPPEPSTTLPLRPESVRSATELQTLFANHQYQWPPESAIPAIALHSLPPDLHRLSVTEKKKAFLRILLPLVIAENERIQLEREWLLQVVAREVKADPQRLAHLSVEYGLDSGELKRAGVHSIEELASVLLIHVDTLPVALVLAQAANESGWGTSRFSRVANNLFGQWTWDADNGIAPLRRPNGANYFVRRFQNLRQSVRSYMHNLNSGHAYDRLRRLRAQMREKGEPLDPVVLAFGLKRYSARGAAYVREIQALIRGNGLNTLGPLDLAR